jgi:hypothetical protein
MGLLDPILDRSRMHLEHSIFLGGMSLPKIVVPKTTLDVEILTILISLSLLDGLGSLPSVKDGELLFLDNEWSPNHFIRYGFPGIYLGKGCFEIEISIDTKVAEDVGWCHFAVGLIRQESSGLGFDHGGFPQSRQTLDYRLCWILRQDTHLEKENLDFRLDHEDKGVLCFRNSPRKSYERLPHREFIPPK